MLYYVTLLCHATQCRRAVSVQPLSPHSRWSFIGRPHKYEHFRLKVQSGTEKKWIAMQSVNIRHNLRKLLLAQHCFHRCIMVDGRGSIRRR